MLAHPSPSPIYPRWNCILDPALALSAYGVSFVKHLGKVMDLWIVRELWQILDNPYSYLQHPQWFRSGMQSELATEQPCPDPDQLNWVISAWEAFLAETNLSSLNLFWIGDRPRESVLPKYQNLDLFWRWEALAQLLDQQHDPTQAIDGKLMLAFRDAIALVASLESAFILTYQQAKNDSNAPPGIGQALQTWHIPCQQLPLQDPVVSLERSTLTQLLIQAGLSKLLWTELHLVILHLVIPKSFELYPKPGPDRATSPLEKELNQPSDSIQHIWSNAQGFWYEI